MGEAPVEVIALTGGSRRACSSDWRNDQELYFARRRKRVFSQLCERKCIAQSIGGRAYCSLTYAEFVWALWLMRCDAKLTQLEAFRPAVIVTMSHKVQVLF